MTWTYLTNLTYLITLASIIGTVANIFKKRWCFVLWLFTNTAWLIVDAYNGLYSQALLFLVYVGLSVWGLIQWKREGKKPHDTD